MLQVKTLKKPDQLMKIDSFEYGVRSLGGAEISRVSQATRAITKLEKKIEEGTATEAEKEKHSALVEDILSTCIDMFDSKGNEEAQKHFDRISPEELFRIVGEVFESMKAVDGASS